MSSRERMQKLRFMAFCVFLPAFAGSTGTASAAAIGKTYFFANRAACAASGAFTARECAGAFANAHAQLLDKAPRFASGGECRLHFRICEVSQPGTPADDEALSYAPADDLAYTPAALGIEMVATAAGVEAAPTLAVDTPSQMFPPYPVLKPYAPEQHGRTVQARSLPQNEFIPPSDHFEPFSKRKPSGGPVTFTASALGAIEKAADNRELREERLMRLRMAPFVE